MWFKSKTNKKLETLIIQQLNEYAKTPLLTPPSVKKKIVLKLDQLSQSKNLVLEKSVKNRIKDFKKFLVPVTFGLTILSLFLATSIFIKNTNNFKPSYPSLNPEISKYEDINADLVLKLLTSNKAQSNLSQITACLKTNHFSNKHKILSVSKFKIKTEIKTLIVLSNFSPGKYLIVVTDANCSNNKSKKLFTKIINLN